MLSSTRDWHPSRTFTSSTKQSVISSLVRVLHLARAETSVIPVHPFKLRYVIVLDSPNDEILVIPVQFDRLRLRRDVDFPRAVISVIDVQQVSEIFATP
jgi:hypothetical protein